MFIKFLFSENQISAQYNTPLSMFGIDAICINRKRKRVLFGHLILLVILSFHIFRFTDWKRNKSDLTSVVPLSGSWMDIRTRRKCFLSSYQQLGRKGSSVTSRRTLWKNFFPCETFWMSFANGIRSVVLLWFSM